MASLIYIGLRLIRVFVSTMSSTTIQYKYELDPIAAKALQLNHAIDPAERLYPIICCLRNDLDLSNLPISRRLEHFVENAGSVSRYAMLRYLCTGNTTSPFPEPATPRERILRPSLDELFYNVHEELYDTIRRITDAQGGDNFVKVVLSRLFRGFGKIAEVAENVLRERGIPAYHLPNGSNEWASIIIPKFPTAFFVKLEAETDMNEDLPLLSFLRCKAVPYASEIADHSADQDLRYIAGNPRISEWAELAALDPRLKSLLLMANQEHKMREAEAWRENNVVNRFESHAKLDPALEDVFVTESPRDIGGRITQEQITLLTQSTLSQVVILKLQAQLNANMIGFQDQSYFKIKEYLKGEISASYEVRRKSKRPALKFFNENGLGARFVIDQKVRKVATALAERENSPDLAVLAASKTFMFVCAISAVLLDANLGAALALLETGEETPERLQMAETYERHFLAPRCFLEASNQSDVRDAVLLLMNDALIEKDHSNTRKVLHRFFIYLFRMALDEKIDCSLRPELD